MDAITPPALLSTGTEIALATDLAHRAKAYAQAAKSDSTRRAYQSDWEHFEAWCQERGVTPLPADPIAVVLCYMTAHASTFKVGTLQRRLVAIRERHRYAGFDLDTNSVAFRDVWRGIRRTEGRARPRTKKAPFMIALVRRAVRSLPDTLQGHRDRALILIGFAAALRRSELVSLEARPRDGAGGWIEERSDGLAVHLTYSKTDQEAEGSTVGVPLNTAERDLCPVRAYRAWLKASEIIEGPIFRPITRHGHMGSAAMTGAAIAGVVKRIVTLGALAEGRSEEEAELIAARFAGHSLRSGHATSAAANGAPGRAIQRQLRHKSYNTTLEYIQDGSLFEGNSASFALK